MQDRKTIYDKVFFVVSFLGMLFVLLEIIMQMIGKTVCFTEGCKVVAQLVRYGDISILVLGMLMFSSLAILAKLNFARNKPAFERLINFIIIVSLACEGFFMGYLVFRIHTACIFCVIVFSFLVTLGILRLLSRHHEVLAGFAALAAIFTLLYLVLPVGVTIALPGNERLILFYSKDCKYCAEVKAELEKNKIIVTQLDVGAYAGLLKSIGIEGVPTLVVNDQNQKIFLVGQEAIRRYILVCTEEKSAAIRPRTKKQPRNTAASPQKGDKELKLDIFIQPEILTQSSGTNAGLCKEEEICK